ncbi:hypothetical protein V8C34DRAFT_277496 [Trichoderma compactum]
MPWQLGAWMISQQPSAAEDLLPPYSCLLACTGTGAHKHRNNTTRHRAAGRKRLPSGRCPDGLDQDSPARVAAIGASSGVTWTDPTSRGRVPAIQRPCPI